MHVAPMVAGCAPPPRQVVFNATIVTQDSADRVVRGYMVIEHGVITEIAHGSPPPRQADEERIDAEGGIVLPGFVNAHTHLAMSMLRGVADGTDLDAFLARVLPLEGALLDDQFVAAGTGLAAAECVRSGITSALDMYFFPEASLAMTERVGLRLHTGPAFIQFPGADGRPWPQRMRWAEEWMLRPPTGSRTTERDEAAAGGGPVARSTGSTRWVAPHSTYLLTESQLRDVARLADDTGARIHVHACETRAELEQVANLHGGRTPIQVLADSGLLTNRTVLAHAVHLTPTDVALIADAGAHVSHNPASNAKLGSGICPVRELLDAGVNIALGTDGAASANDLDLWMAMRLACLVPGAAYGDPRRVLPREALAMATRNGARALGVDDVLGSLAVGMRADYIRLRTASLDEAPHLAPTHDPIGSLVFAASRAEVSSVVVGGVAVVEAGKVLHVPDHLPALVDEAHARLRSLQDPPAQELL